MVKDQFITVMQIFGLHQLSLLNVFCPVLMASLCEEIKTFSKTNVDQTRFITAAIKTRVECKRLKLFSNSRIKMDFRAIST